MNKKKEKTPYANLSIKKVTAPNKIQRQPRVNKLVGGDLRAKSTGK